MPNCGDRVWKRQVELLTSQLWYFNVCSFFFLPRPELSEGTSASALISEVKERKFGQYVRIFPVSLVIKICMKVEIHGYPYVCKYSILLFFFDDRNSVCDRIMLAPSFPNVTLHEKHVLRWTHITMTRSAIGSKWNDTAASEQRRVRWHD